MYGVLPDLFCNIWLSINDNSVGVRPKAILLDTGGRQIQSTLTSTSTYFPDVVTFWGRTFD